MSQTIESTRAQQATTQLGAAPGGSVGLSAVLAGIYYYGGVVGVADQTPLRATMVATVVASVTAGLLWWFNRDALLRPAAETSRRTVVLGVLAVLSIVGFWVGITAPVCVTALLFGRKSTAAGRRRVGVPVTLVASASLAVAVVLSVLGGS
jgi:hypothetical protein